MSLIELRDIRKTYLVGTLEVPVLHGISVKIQPGDYIALMGSSGSGKSTLMNILGCLDTPTSGEYLLEGQNVSGLTSDERAVVRSSRIGFVFQNFNLLRRASALENVMLPLDYAPNIVPDAEARARDLLTRVGLADRMDHEPSQLSGGQQQRVALARALINQPAILLADEPTGNLDSKTTEEILGMFQQLNQRDGITIVLVTHEPDVAEHAKRILRLADGLVVQESTAGKNGHPPQKIAETRGGSALR